MMTSTHRKFSLVARINLFLLGIFLVVYAFCLFIPSSSINKESPSPFVKCSSLQCHHQVSGGNGIKMKAILEDPRPIQSKPQNMMVRREQPSFLNEIRQGMKIGMVNMEDEDIKEWNEYGQIIPIQFEKVSKFFKWEDLFPEWIDEEEEIDGPSCPEIPMPEFDNYNVDMVVAKLPCKYPADGWKRDVFRLQVHLIVANLAVRKNRGINGIWKKRVKVVFLSKCRPMPEMFRCEDLVRHEGDWWYYEPDLKRLEEKVNLPIGSCNLALPLWGKEINEVYDISKMQDNAKRIKREAYATVLHSSDIYVCGAITLAQSLLQTGTKRDLILLIDNSISPSKRHALAKAGWKLRRITRIRNPKAENGTYNEYNYTKFRLWQLMDYDKIIFIDSDILVLRNLDILFNFPQISASGNDIWLFNSGVMVIEPSNCTFKMFMKNTKAVESYNGGDQGFLNEMFVWWHRLPRRVNFLKNFWSNSSNEVSFKNQLFGSDPPKVYAIHYLGLKPWNCYRDYDCNWDLEDQWVYASDVAHQRWWKLHDAMDVGLQKFCGLSDLRKIELKWDRRMAKKHGLKDHHWKINVTDPRQFD